MELVFILREPGIPSKRKSIVCVDYVPGLCTRRPSLLPVVGFSENPGLDLHGFIPAALSEKSFKLDLSKL